MAPLPDPWARPLSLEMIYGPKIRDRMEHFFALVRQGEPRYRAGQTLKEDHQQYALTQDHMFLGAWVSAKCGYVVHIPPMDHIRFIVQWWCNDFYYQAESFETYEEAWDWLETWRLMNGMNVDGSTAV